MKKNIEVINVTPKWIGIYPILENFIHNGTPKQKNYVCNELKNYVNMQTIIK